MDEQINKMLHIHTTEYYSEQINKMLHIHTMEYYSGLKNNDILTHATTWMNLEDMVSKRSQTQKDNIT